MSRSKGGRRMSQVKPGNRQPSPTLTMTAHEIDLLIKLANYYEKAMGPTRHLVRLTAPKAVKLKYRFLKEESEWLRLFAESARDRLRDSEDDEVAIAFTVRTVVAFWGRLLSNLNSTRSRRRLTRDAVQARERMASRLQQAIVDLRTTHPDLIAQEILSRRSREVPWMQEALERTAEN